MEMATPICANCGSNYAQWPDSTYCEFCNYQSPNIICSHCRINSATSACLCGFPLPVFCSDCSAKHLASDKHSIQPISILAMLKTREQYESHKARLDSIEFIQGKLNMWCKGTVDRAKSELENAVKKLHLLLDSQHEKMKSELEATGEKIDRICRCLEDMKGDYSLQSGTFFDEIVGGKVEEAQLRSLESLFTYTANSIDPTISILGSIVIPDDRVPDVHPNRIHRGSMILLQQVPNVQDYAAGVPAQQYEKTSNVYDCRQFYNTVTNPQTYSCSICGSCFLDPKGWQVIGDGNYCCSEGCKKKYDSYFCQKCTRQITDYSWWSKAQQTYPGHIDQFPLYCSLYCFSSSLPQQQEIKCIWCQIPIVATYEREMKMVQLDCLHVFHDIECLIKYMARVSENFTEEVNFACPICRANIPAEIVEMVLRTANERKRGETQKCQKCNSQKACYAFKCKHILCDSCCLWKKKYLGLVKGKPKCSLCKKQAWYE